MIYLGVMEVAQFRYGIGAKMCLLHENDVSLASGHSEEEFGAFFWGIETPGIERNKFNQWVGSILGGCCHFGCVVKYW